MSFSETLCALLAIQMQNCVPSRRPSLEPDDPVRNPSDHLTGSWSGQEADADEPVTAREAVNWFNSVVGMDYGGHGPPDVHITAPQLAEIVGYSEATARRRLEYFEERGVVKSNLDGRFKYWVITDGFSGLSDDKIRSQEQVTENAKELLEIAKEG